MTAAGVVLVAAMARNRVIGLNNDMPWHLPEDLRHFRQVTNGHKVVMGRKTFEAILHALGKPLPQRENVVLTRSTDFQPAGCSVAHSLSQALLPSSSHPGPVLVIGGGEIYAQCLPLADALWLTEIDAEFAGDAWFPAFDRAQWQETSRQSHRSASNDLAFSFVEYRRTAGGRT